MRRHPRRFLLVRSEDVTGVSGTGVVGEGIQATDGHVAMRWRSDMATWVIHESIETVEKIHGHLGRTTVKWLDEEAC